MIDATTPEGRAELRKLADENAARTIGQWFTSTGWDTAPAAIKRTDAHGTHVTIANKMSRAHAALIVAAVNALPALLDQIDEADKVRQLAARADASFRIARKRGEQTDFHMARADQAEATIARVRAIADHATEYGPDLDPAGMLADLLTALNGA